MLSISESNTIADIKARVLAKKPVSKQEKQLLLDLLKREGAGLSARALDHYRKEGLNITGIKVL